MTPSVQPSFGGFRFENEPFRLISGTENDSIESPDGLYELIMENDGNLVLYNKTVGQVQMWQSSTSSEIGPFAPEAEFNFVGNIIVENSLGKQQWQSNTCCDGCILTLDCFDVYGNVLYLPGDSSECECTQYMCIIALDQFGGKTNYYAVTDGSPFETVAGC
jgi:hypothetical protein